MAKNQKLTDFLAATDEVKDLKRLRQAWNNATNKAAGITVQVRLEINGTVATQDECALAGRVFGERLRANIGATFAEAIANAEAKAAAIKAAAKAEYDQLFAP